MPVRIVGTNLVGAPIDLTQVSHAALAAAVNAANQGQDPNAAAASVVAANVAPTPSNQAGLAQAISSLAASGQASSLLNAGIAASQASAPSGPQLVDPGPTQARIQDLGFPTTSISGSATATLTSAPQTYFRPDRMFLSSAFAANVTIQSILVGNKEQLLNGNPSPGSMYSELAVDSGVSYDTASPAVSISIAIANNLTTTLSVTPGMRGRSGF